MLCPLVLITLLILKNLLQSILSKPFNSLNAQFLLNNVCSYVNITQFFLIFTVKNYFRIRDVSQIFFSKYTTNILNNVKYFCSVNI